MSPPKPSIDLRVTEDGPVTAETTQSGLNRTAMGHAAITAMDAGLIVLDMQGRILWANPAYCRLMGRELNEMIGLNPLSFAVPPDEQPSPEEIAAFRFSRPADGTATVVRRRNLGAAGVITWIELRVTFSEVPSFGEIAVVVATDVSRDVESQLALEAQARDLSRITQTDRLTGLQNRSGLLTALEQMLTAPARDDAHIGLLNIDLQQFKALNETFGHQVGDLMLQHVADAICQQMAAADVAARTGGDEFLLIRREVPDAAALAAFGADLVAGVRSPVEVGGTALSTDINIGAVLAPAGRVSAEALLQQASFALSCAKEDGAGQVAIYDSALHDRKHAQDMLAQDLRNAVETDALTYYFQPTLRVETGLISGFETLVRWDHPTLGHLNPVDFLPIARQTGLIGALDHAAFRAAVQMKMDLTAAGFPRCRVGFNGSAEFLAQENIVATVLHTLQEAAIPPDEIVVEILETVVFNDTSEDNPLVRTVNALHQAGVGVMLDDFGTGYAGLTHLAQLSVSGVKIDRGLTMNVLKDQTSAKIIRMMYELCRDLNLIVVTEGVEDQAEYDAITALGGTVIQGYLIGKPMPKAEAIALMTAPMALPRRR